MNKLVLFSEEKRKNIYFSNINFIFGYSESGKTTRLEDLKQIFSGKSKKYLINGIPIKPDDFNIISISTKEDINSHLKLSSKSLIKKYLSESSYSLDFMSLCNNVEVSLEKIIDELNHKMNFFLPNSTITAKESKTLDLILDNISINLDNSSSSYTRNSLFALLKIIAKETQNTIIFIDDFDYGLDEENVIRFIDMIKNINAYFFLTSGRAITQSIIDNECSIFAVRNQKLMPIPNISDLINISLETQPIYTSYEEYMLSKGYLDLSGIKESMISEIQSDQKANILRILTAKEPIISIKQVKGKVTIVPKGTEDEKLYQSIFEILSIDSSNNYQII